MLEKFSLLVISVALLLLGVYEVVTWPQWALNDTALFILLGRSFRQLYALAELFSATSFAIFGLFGIYFAVVEGARSHKLTGRFEILILLPILVLFVSAGAFMVLGAELMAHNRFLGILAGRVWSWRYRHADRKTLVRIEEMYKCCGWAHLNQFALSPFCHDNPAGSIKSCTSAVLNLSGRELYRQGLIVTVYTVPLLLLAGLIIWSHKSDPVSADVEEAETLNERRKQLYTGNAPAIQIQ